MITTITGSPNEDKMSLALKIAEGKKKKIITLTSEPNYFTFSFLEHDTEILIIDNVKNNFLDELYFIFRLNSVTAEKQGDQPYSVKTPDVVLILKQDLAPKGY